MDEGIRTAIREARESSSRPPLEQVRKAVEHAETWIAAGSLDQAPNDSSADAVEQEATKWRTELHRVDPILAELLKHSPADQDLLFLKGKLEMAFDALTPVEISAGSARRPDLERAALRLRRSAFEELRNPEKRHRGGGALPVALEGFSSAKDPGGRGGERGIARLRRLPEMAGNRIGNAQSGPGAGERPSLGCFRVDDYGVRGTLAGAELLGFARRRVNSEDDQPGNHPEQSGHLVALRGGDSAAIAGNAAGAPGFQGAFGDPRRRGDQELPNHRARLTLRCVREEPS